MQPQHLKHYINSMNGRVLLTSDQIRDELRPYGFDPTIDFCDHVRSYIELLQRWNRRVSLTTVISPIDILRFHFGESLFAISAVGIGSGRLADVGSGAGFPGAPLAMALPSLEVTLIESNMKKAAFLEELKRTIALENARVCHGRAGAIGPAGVFETVTARAVGSYVDLLRWARKRLGTGGRILLWLGERQIGLIRDSREWEWQSPVPIPGAKARFIIEGIACQMK